MHRASRYLIKIKKNIVRDRIATHQIKLSLSLGSTYFGGLNRSAFSIEVVYHSAFMHSSPFIQPCISHPSNIVKKQHHPKNYPFFTVYKMGNFTQNEYGKKWVNLAIVGEFCGLEDGRGGVFRGIDFVRISGEGIPMIDLSLLHDII